MSSPYCRILISGIIQTKLHNNNEHVQSALTDDNVDFAHLDSYGSSLLTSFYAGLWFSFGGGG